MVCARANIHDGNCDFLRKGWKRHGGNGERVLACGIFYLKKKKVHEKGRGRLWRALRLRADYWGSESRSIPRSVGKSFIGGRPGLARSHQSPGGARWAGARELLGDSVMTRVRRSCALTLCDGADSARMKLCPSPGVKLPCLLIELDISSTFSS